MDRRSVLVHISKSSWAGCLVEAEISLLHTRTMQRQMSGHLLFYPLSSFLEVKTPFFPSQWQSGMHSAGFLAPGWPLSRNTTLDQPNTCLSNFYSPLLPWGEGFENCWLFQQLTASLRPGHYMKSQLVLCGDLCGMLGLSISEGTVTTSTESCAICYRSTWILRISHWDSGHLAFLIFAGN